MPRTRPLNPAFVFCLIFGLLAIAVAIDAQSPVGPIIPLTGQAPGGPCGGALAGTFPNCTLADPTNVSTLNVSTLAAFGATPASAGVIRLSSATGINMRNNGNSADIVALDTTAADIVRIGASGAQGIEATVGKINFGCSTSACVQWNRSGTTFQALLADQSARANVQVSEINAQTFKSSTNCSSAAAPAVCAAAATGSVVVAAAGTTVTVNTTAVTANSVIMVTFDSSLGTKLGVTCNVTEPSLYGVTARTAATSFVITATASVTNPACFSYFISN